ncbi:hypothetical protein FKP32DRAFT_1559295 [Trametes sanguinea]|nr:hypothetical protein FKP32DRAFT_1559295 [Trametes sanguinea]
MHNLFLGELRHHCIDIWGLKTAENRGQQRQKQASDHTPAMQQSNLDRLVAALRRGTLKSASSIRKDYLEALVKFNPCISVTNPTPTKADYAAALSRWVSSAPNGVDSLRIPPVLPYATNYFSLEGGRATTQAKDPHEHSVFSGRVLDAVRKDIANVTLPSWLQRPPRNLGSADHGKLKADQWRTACTVNMVITLVRLWSDASATRTEQLALTNFLHLVAAVDLATRQTMSAERAHKFDHHMMEYVRGIRSLYDAKLVPNHHLALHLIDCLLLFGPTLAWWAFPFERYNGLLQRLNTNHKAADMPKTFMRYFYIGAKIRWTIAADSLTWPDHPEFHDLVNTFQSAFQDVARGSRVLHSSPILSTGEDLLSQESSRSAGKELALDRDLYRALLTTINARLPLGSKPYASRYDPPNSDDPFLPSSATFLPSVSHAGVTVSTFHDRPGNSFILFQKAGNEDGRCSAGQVRRIFQHSRTQSNVTVFETYLVVREYKRLSAAHSACDPYRRFPDIDTWLCYNEADDIEVIIPLSDFISHFASHVYTPDDIATECIVVKSLDRVRL